jgi:hypothetical protein
MPLQVGTWTMNVGGTVTQLQILKVDSQGNGLANIGADPALAVSLLAVWDEDSQKLMLLSSAQIFVGYLFTDTVNLTGVTGSVLFTLVGSAESFRLDQNQATQQIGQPTARRSTLGWYAQIGVD